MDRRPPLGPVSGSGSAGSASRPSPRLNSASPPSPPVSDDWRRALDLLRRENDILRRQNSDLGGAVAGPPSFPRLRSDRRRVLAIASLDPVSAKINAGYATRLRDAERDKLDLTQAHRELRSEIARLKARIDQQRDKIKLSEKTKRTRMKEDVTTSLSVVAATLKCAIEAVAEAQTRLGVEPEIANDENRRTSNATSISSDGGFTKARMPEMIPSISKSPVRPRGERNEQDRFPPPHRLAKIDEINSPPPLPPSDRTIQLSRTPNMERSSSLSSSPYSSWNPSPIAATSSGGTLGSASAGATPAPRTNRQGNGFSDLARFVSDEGTTASGDSSALGSARRERRNSTTAISSYAEPALRTKLRRGDKPQEGHLGWTSSPLKEVTNTKR